jgi:low affinity Fe/Cu permease
MIAVAGAATVLLFAWLGRLAGVSPDVLWTAGAAFAALVWMIVLVSAPWNLYFGARRVVTQTAESRRRGIALTEAHEPEARRIAKRMLWFAIGGHLATAAATAAAAYASSAAVGYYIAAFFLLSTAARPAVAYFAHLRQRINAMTRETTHPRNDVVTLQRDVTDLKETAKKLQEQLDEHRRTTTDDLARLTTALNADLRRLEDTQAADRTASRSGDEALRTRIDQMIRRIDATLDGVSDHQELLIGLRALVRMLRSDPA